MTLPTEQVASYSPTRPSRWARAGRWLLRLLGLAIALAALRYGLKVRDNVWAGSVPVRFTGDIGNALHQGSAVLRNGANLARAEGKQYTLGNLPTSYLLLAYLQRYDLVAQEAPDAQYNLDYTPARLLIMSFWARYVHRIDPDRSQFAQADAIPLLRLNTGCDIAAAVLMFLLVRHWVKRNRLPSRSSSEWAWCLGLLAALVSWFNPSTLLDAHVWPQWDVWIVPFYLAAIFLASRDWWFIAGMCLALGAMFKGQVLMTAPVLVLWPLFAGRGSGFLRIVVGFCSCSAALSACWLARNLDAWVWIASIAMLCGAMIAIGGRPDDRSARRWRWPIWSIVPIAAIVIRPGIAANHWLCFLIVPIALTPLIARRLRWSGKIVWLWTMVTACVVSSSFLFSGSWAWYWVGFAYATHHFPVMNVGSINFATVLDSAYHWQELDVVTSLFHRDVTLKTLLATIYGTALALCAIGAAVRDRRNDARLLISLTAPWVIMFCIMPQMHERYFMWAAALAGVAIATSPGMTLMSLLVIALSTLNIGHTILSRNSNFWPMASSNIDPSVPSIGWTHLLLAAVFLFAALWPVRGSVKPGQSGT